MIGGTEDLDTDNDAESMAAKHPESALQCLSLSSRRLTSCVRNDRCHVKPSGILCVCATRFKGVPLTDLKFLRVAPQIHGSANINVLNFVKRIRSFNDTLKQY
jgi:hypothetical protein